MQRTQFMKKKMKGTGIVITDGNERKNIVYTENALHTFLAGLTDTSEISSEIAEKLLLDFDRLVFLVSTANICSQITGTVI